MAAQILGLELGGKNPPYVFPLSTSSATLDNVGGKGASLAKMARAGLPVPDGFLILTDAYRLFVQHNGLQARLLEALRGVEGATPDTLESASQSIRAGFGAGEIPAELASAIREAYRAMASPPAAVAVRSSATAEDLPEASFAGQQDTYLNVYGADAVLEAVKKCWASLWTARAIAYRIENHIDQAAVAMGVVVQEMVQAEAAGVLFTANPLNGRGDEMVINAAWGLGEALVSGMVSPDLIVADKATGRVKKMVVAEKAVITVAAEAGTQQVPLLDRRRKAQVLKAAQVSELVEIARRIEALYGAPQDIEWCRKGGQIFIVQARPITAMAEAQAPSQWKLPKGSYAAMRNNIVELMPAPLSPLFATLGRSAINASLHRFLNGSFSMRDIMPDEIVIVVNGYAYNNGSLSLKGLVLVLLGASRIARKMFTGAVERWTQVACPEYIRVVESWQTKNWRALPSAELVDCAYRLTESAIDAYAALVSGVIPAAWISEALFTAAYRRLIQRRGDPPAPTFLLGYDSLPIRADKALYGLAEWARQQPVLCAYLEKAPSERLAADASQNTAPPRDVPLVLWQEWQKRLHMHLQEFGHTLYDLDFAHPIPAEDPAPVLEALKLYLLGQGVDPQARQRESQERRQQAVEMQAQRLKGWRLRLFNRRLSSAQKFAPLREDGLAEIGLAYPLIRQMLHEVGSRFKEKGVIPAAGDIYWLTMDEVVRAATLLDCGETPESLVAKILLRMAEHKSALRANPPAALPQMKIFGFDLMSLKARRGRGGKGSVIKGVAASPGRVTGRARVLLGPQDFSQMRPGEVLVAAITTPAWTPLFAMASAIVTDVGGPLSHGSIVAREYGIPAVLGTGIATRRIQTGQMVTVDGEAGEVRIGVE